jgi:hypothetical protein
MEAADELMYNHGIAVAISVTLAGRASLELGAVAGRGRVEVGARRIVRAETVSARGVGRAKTVAARGVRRAQTVRAGRVGAKTVRAGGGGRAEAAGRGGGGRARVAEGACKSGVRYVCRTRRRCALGLSSLTSFSPTPSTSRSQSPVERMPALSWVTPESSLPPPLRKSDRGTGSCTELLWMMGASWTVWERGMVVWMRWRSCTSRSITGCVTWLGA